MHVHLPNLTLSTEPDSHSAFFLCVFQASGPVPKSMYCSSAAPISACCNCADPCLAGTQDQDDPAQFSNETCGPAHSQASRVAASSHSSASPPASPAATIHEVQQDQLTGSKRRSRPAPAALPDPKHPRKMYASGRNGGHVPGQDPLAPSPGSRFLGRPVQVNPIDHIFQFHKVSVNTVPFRTPC